MGMYGIFGYVLSPFPLNMYVIRIYICLRWVPTENVLSHLSKRSEQTEFGGLPQ